MSRLTLATMSPRSLGRLTRLDIIRYGGASGDFSPIHFDDTQAHLLGFPSVIAMGLLPGGMLAGAVSQWLNGAFIRSMRIRFVANVFPDTELVVSATLYEESEELVADAAIHSGEGTLLVDANFRINGSGAHVVRDIDEEI